ncbi:MAG: hypothetical protein RMZ41_003115 [Nostoc sp. DedVER02]|uniref:hypothetical protein n=1 Tax=unclassified Nostoc TaxID=2593658 RepID=UPI002AD2BDD3|nr:MULTISPECIES: hypothetical protein [unclassified Nostoc]MDZ7986854.1 hypothetical protein [Nostoc sp. DedVER02]MDZ8115756.1 hypothetical protein [Nostoc sp. DedVER01b]
MRTQELTTTSLDDRAPGIVFFPKAQMCSVLEISPSTLDRYRNDLIEEGVPRFEWYFYSIGYERDSAECLYQYAQLIRERRKGRAKAEIVNHMKKFWEKYDSNQS